MASAIDLSDLAVRDAYERLVSSATNQDYVLYEYVPGTDKLKVAAEGCGGLEELEEEFHDGRIQYAFVRVKDPKSGLNKCVHKESRLDTTDTVSKVRADQLDRSGSA